MNQTVKNQLFYKSLLVIIVISLISKTLTFWYADTIFALGQRSSELGNPGRAYNLLTDALNLRGGEPFYKSELGYAAASAALALKDTDATLSAELKDQAVAQTEQVLTENPKNTSYWRTAVRTYFELYSLDESFLQKTLEATKKTIELAPTDPKLYYNEAIILGTVDRNNEAIIDLQKAVELKPNYRDAYIALGLFYFDTGAKQKAVESMNKVLEIAPNDEEALDKLNEWGKEGISTKSGTRN